VRPLGVPSRLLTLPAPPHDPFSVMLAGHIGPTPSVGWRAQRLARAQIDHAIKALVLSPAPASSRWLTEPSGSFGGLRPPANVAVTQAGDVLLLDRSSGAIRMFDACCCRFVTVPCTARVAEPCPACLAKSKPGRAAAPRDRLSDPQGLAACGDDVFIADRGHHRVVRYAIGSWVPREVIRLPAAVRAGLNVDWAPTGLAVDERRRLVVSDPRNGRMDWFSASGRWVHGVAVEPNGANVAVDCDGAVYVVVDVGREKSISVPDQQPVTTEFDGETDGFQWRTLAIVPASGGARVDVDVEASDVPSSDSYRNDPKNREWAAWLRADSLGQAATPTSLGGREGRYLRLRFRPAPGHVGDNLDLALSGGRVLRVVGDATEVVTNARADLMERFGRPSIVVDAEGQLDLLCEDGAHLFDLGGTLVSDDRRRRGDRFERQGTYLSSAIDSRIDACPWHRIELRGALPSGTSVEVRALTAEIELSPSELAELPPTDWTSIEPARVMQPVEKWVAGPCSWDGLLQAPPGRFLWLQLVLRGEGSQSPCISSAVIEYPRISMRRYLPGVFGSDPAGADFTDRFTAIFDRTLRSIESRVDRLPMAFDPLSAPAEAPAGHPDMLSWLGRWIGVTLSRGWSVDRRRRYLKSVARLYCQRGTAEGLRRQLLLLLGFDRAYSEHCLAVRPQCRCTPPRRNCGVCAPCTPAEAPPLLLEHFRLRRWLYAGHGRLGTDSELWGQSIVGRSELSGDGRPPSGNAQIGVTRLDTVPDPLRDPFHVDAHQFSVFVPARIRDDQAERRALEQLLAVESPAHTNYDIRYVEPRFRVGVQASIGLDSVIARIPSGVTLDATHLRQGSVLSGSPFGPHLEVDKARVGSTTRLT
jgi:phage tail-like protein